MTNRMESDMKSLTMLLAVWLMLGTCLPFAAANPMDELVEQFGSEYEALVPAPNSSVDTDYAIRQVALGSFYTTQSLRLLYEQNQALVERQEELAEKYDRLIELNERIVDLLTRIADQSQPPETPGFGEGG